MPHVRSVSIGVWLTRGSRHEPPAHEGIAHFVEHMLFKGTATRSAEDIAQQIDSIGGHLDAFTSKEYAGYFIKVLDEHLPLAVDVLSDLVTAPAFDAAEIEREKKVVLEEIKMVEDTPDDLVHEIFAGGFWPRPSARPADSRPARDGVGARPADPAALLRRRLRGLELRRRGGRQPRTRAGAPAGRARVPGRAGPRVGDCRRRPDHRRRRRACAPRSSSRATSASARRPWPTTTPTATSPSRSTPCSAAR